MKYASRCLALILALPFLAGCADHRSTSQAFTVALETKFKKTVIETEMFSIMALKRFTDTDDTVVVYIEGDGRSWLSRRKLSGDPTPTRPIGLLLALEDTSANVIYLGRPCQYIMNAACSPIYWSSHRFSGEVIAAMNEALDKALPAGRHNGVRLVGFSGGGAVAVLMAAARSDVIDLRTLAGNLDHKFLNANAGVTALAGSLNPMDFASKLERLPQLHINGLLDEVVPPVVAFRYQREGNNHNCVGIISLDTVDHENGWEKAWREIQYKSQSCLKN